MTLTKVVGVGEKSLRRVGSRNLGGVELDANKDNSFKYCKKLCRKESVIRDESAIKGDCACLLVCLFAYLFQIEVRARVY